ncbi:MAG TPA: aconitate hydratase AcnA [Gammaproteobacteria bacterium]|nr:aconitate hydratase AcnA [Gammaproteobacteria bacterium]
MKNSFKAQRQLAVNGKKYEIYHLGALGKQAERLPFSLKILLENLLRFEDGVNTTRHDIEAVLKWDPKAEPSQEIAFTPSRVVMQDFTGVPAVVDFGAMRDAMKALGGDPEKINPLSPAELVIDHSVQVDHYGAANVADLNSAIEYQRNTERYSFLRWGQKALQNFRVVPPSTGIVHQVNLEYLARVIFGQVNDGVLQAYPDTVVGTDSHTTMINGVGVLGWGVGGIEAEAAMLGQPVTMLIPQVVGFRLYGRLAEGATATDLVLTVTEMLRKKGVVNKFVEFFGDGLDHLSLADRATIANMAPEYGATCGIFPIDQETIRYLELTGRSKEQTTLVEAYAKEQGMWRNPGDAAAEYSDVLELDLGKVVASLAGPKRPQDRIALTDAGKTIVKALQDAQQERGDGKAAASKVNYKQQEFELRDGAVVIAAITSCTNTSNPSVIMAAGLLAKNAVARGVQVKPWVKTSLAPGSLVVTEYLKKAGLLSYLEQLGFNVVGYGCTTCIGNSGPLPDEISAVIQKNKLVVASVLSGNRNFEGRIHQDVRMNFLASPPLVVAYAIAGRADFDPYKEPLAKDKSGKEVFLKDIWPSPKDVSAAIAATVDRKMFEQSYANVFAGDSRWNKIDSPAGALFDWEEDSTYIRKAPYFDGMGMDAEGISEIKGARCLAKLGDSVTTDHISPAGSIKVDSPAGKYLIEHGVSKADFNSYGSRRGNHEVMVRGTFANVRLRNQLAPGTEGGWTRFQPDDEQMTIYDASVKYIAQGTPLIVLAGKEYGTGSSRDWAAKGSLLLGIRAVIVESFERIHRSNLVGMGILPLQFKPGESHGTLGLTGKESYDFEGLKSGAKELTVTAVSADGSKKKFKVDVRIDTPKEWEYYLNGGILKYVLRQIIKRQRQAA